MTIPDNITKEHIKNAISEVKNTNIPKERISYRYFLIEDDLEFPPKYVLSIANRYANGTELDSDDFNAIQAARFLEKLGFKINHNGKEKENEVPRSFWIEKTIVKDRPDRIDGDRALGKALWSPQKDKRGADIYKNMRLVKEGDIVIHLIDNKKFVGTSVVSGEAEKADGLKGTDWERPSYLIKLNDFVRFNYELDRNEILSSANKNRLNTIARDSEVFYNSNLDLRQGAYLTPCPYELAQLINDVYKNRTGKKLPHTESILASKILLDHTEKLDVFNSGKLWKGLIEAGLKFSVDISTRLIASVLTKPFIILTGLSGSGKTKLAQAFTKWISRDKSQYCIVPVGADWINREPLLGYPNALSSEEYVKPDNGVLDLLIRANENPDLPYFLILDEMNLSHVERYFADFLSVMESNEVISLYSGNERQSSDGTAIPTNIGVPPNLFLIGTVNIDETTYMFSPKVLDRANVIEFRVSSDEITSFLENPQPIDLSQLEGHGAAMAQSFLELAKNKQFENPDLNIINATLMDFFNELKKLGAEFGYRTANEIVRLINQLSVVDAEMPIDQKIDIAIMQKLLPKLHGSRRKLCPVLIALGGFCIEKGSIEKIETDVFEKVDFDESLDAVKYPISLEKLIRMYKCAVDNGYASYAEA